VFLLESEEVRNKGRYNYIDYIDYDCNIVQ
jgi:hypothetical protein